MKKENELQKRRPGRFKLKMTFAILILAALSIVELYLMMNFQTEYLYLGIVGLGILCFVYWIVDISFQMNADKESIQEWEYENLYKAEKVSYISMKQSFSDIEKILKDLKNMPDDVMESQKAIGKVVIQRNKENIQTIIDSHKELADRMDALESRLNDGSLQSGDGVPNRQQEILDALQRLEASISNASFTLTKQDIPAIQESEMQEELIMEEPAAELEEKIVTSEELSAADEQVVEEELTVEALIPTEEPAEEEPLMIDDLIIPEEPAAEESVMEEKPAMPDLSDPSHVMTPEEIAALLANM